MKRFLTVLSLCLVFVMVSAATVFAADDLTFCFAFQNLETEFWQAGYIAITETLTNAGYKVIEVNSNQDANKQLEQVKDCIAQDVSGIVVIPVDGSIALTLVAEANKAGIPIGIFNRPPQSEDGDALVVVADNREISKQAVEYMAEVAQEKMNKTGKKILPLIMVGDLGDPNAVQRKEGFYDVINAHPELFETPIEVMTKWDPAVAEASLRDAFTANPDIDFLFTSSDFMFPIIQSVLEPIGKWAKIGEEGHVIMGGLDGDVTACSLIKDKYIESTGVQDLYFEADALMNAMLKAIDAKTANPDEWIPDPGFALTQANFDTRENDMWGCKLLNAQ